MSDERIMEKEECIALYNDVRKDNTDTTWVALIYCGDKIKVGGSGTDFEEFKKMCTPENRVFGFIRFTTGDDMSKRAKFVLITWVGEDVSAMKRAKVSCDKAIVKQVFPCFAKEFMVSEEKDLNADYFIEEVKKAGGANYDAQCE